MDRGCEAGGGGEPGMPKDCGTIYVLAHPKSQEAAFSTFCFSLSLTAQERLLRGLP